MKKNIAVIAGGNSGEHDISMRSGRNIADTLDRSNYEVYFIHLKGLDWKYIASDGTLYDVDKNDFSVVVNHKRIRFDCAFIAIHGNPGEDGKLQGYLDMLGIPYAGCSAAVSALTFNKNLCNKFLSAYGVPMTTSLHLFQGDAVNTGDIIRKVGLPCFVKPCCSGSSVGVSKVLSEKEILTAIKNAFQHDTELIIESFIQGREITCGVMSIKGKVEELAITEIISKKAFFDLEAKYDPNLADEITPAQIDKNVQTQCELMSKNIYQWLGCKGIVRVDYIFNEKGIYFIEINTIPGQTNESIVPKQVRYKNLDFTALCSAFIEEAMHHL
ncbi:MAG: D-alanine--D-alanine ligase [Bacteroidales bacterium]|nr:D-alanine--D-alanine ligase [Bacteroidales bacterium]